MVELQVGKKLFIFSLDWKSLFSTTVQNELKADSFLWKDPHIQAFLRGILSAPPAPGFGVSSHMLQIKLMYSGVSAPAHASFPPLGSLGCTPDLLNCLQLKLSLQSELRWKIFLCEVLTRSLEGKPLLNGGAS